MRAWIILLCWMWLRRRLCRVWRVPRIFLVRVLGVGGEGWWENKVWVNFRGAAGAVAWGWSVADFGVDGVGKRELLSSLIGAGIGEGDLRELLRVRN
jgi:hypothetical protein